MTAATLLNHASILLAASGHVRKAIASCHKAGLGTDDAAVATLERMQQVLAARAEQAKSDAGRLELEAKATPPAPAPWPEFDAAAAKALAGWSDRALDVRQRTYGVYRVAWQGKPLAEFLALDTAARGKLFTGRGDAVRAFVAEHFTAPAPAPLLDAHVLAFRAQPAKPAEPETGSRQQVSDRLSKLTYAELRARCKTEGVNAKGSRVELTSRLVDALTTGAPKAKPAPAATPQTPAPAPVPAAGSLHVADGRGGYRPATEADLVTALDALTQPAAKKAA